MIGSLAGRVAVVTGASSGVGRAIALALAGRGAALWALGRDPARLAETARAAAALGGPVEQLTGDLTDDAEVEALRAAVEAAGGRVDVLVHSAAVLVAGGLASTTADDLDGQYRVNLRVPFALTRALLPALEAAQGTVVFVNSSAGLRANAAAMAYSATKAALRALADSVRDEVNPLGVRVLSVFPGQVATPMQERLRRHQGRPYPGERLLQPEDVAAMVVAAVALPHGAEVTEIAMRPTAKG